MIDTILQFFNQGKLSEAIQAANGAVAANPRDLPLRLILVQLVCFSGDWKRVEKIIQQLGQLDAERDHLALVNFINQMSIGEMQRAAVWNDGMVPEFREQPDELMQKLLWAWNCAREGKLEDYRASIEWLEERTPAMRLTMGDQQLDGLRDFDDRTATILEAFTIQGIYLWLPLSRIRSIQVARPVRLVDHLWSHAQLKMTDDSSLSVYLPGLYFHSLDAEQPEPIRLGRQTEWVDRDGVEVGLGRRLFAAGEEELTLFDFSDAQLSVIEED